VVGDRMLLLDVMGTLVHDPFFVEVPAFFGLTLEELVAQKHPTAWIEFELGKIGEAEFLPRFFSDGRSYDHEGLKRTMHRAYALIDGVAELLDELSRGGAPMHVLSNYPEWYRMIEDRVNLSRLVPWTFVSCRTGLRKPDPAAYLNAAHSLGVDPARCVFVDDRVANCESARAIGMHGIEFTGAARLRADLVSCGVLATGAAP